MFNIPRKLYRNNPPRVNSRLGINRFLSSNYFSLTQGDENIVNEFEICFENCIMKITVVGYVCVFF